MSDEIINKLIDKIKDLPEGTEFTIRKLANEYNVDNQELFDITADVFKKIKELDIAKCKFESNAIVGLPYNIPYIRK